MHAKAALERWKEEAHLLQEEGHRTVVSFVKRSEKFLEMHGRIDNIGLPQRTQRGYHAYLNRQAWVYSTLARKAREKLGSIVPN